MKKNIWRRIFVLPLIPTLLVIAAAAILMVLAFQWRLFDLRGAAIYMFATYALIVACTLYARLMHTVLGLGSEQILAQKKRKISAMKTRYAIDVKRELVPEICYLYRRYFE